jgi:hypothetical protein
MGIFFKKTKYNSISGRCTLDHYHPSRLEKNYCEQLSMLKKNKDIKDFEYAKKYELRVKGVLICSHKPDFTVTRQDGKIEVHETKGMSTMDWVIRKRLFEACYPGIPYIVIK